LVAIDCFVSPDRSCKQGHAAQVVNEGDPADPGLGAPEAA
jgi:hypothetical protein